MRETLQILIQNKTDGPIFITLYPKGDIGGLYPICEGCGGYIETKFDLSPLNDRLLFYTYDFNTEPYTLAAKAFDSIYISTVSTDKIIIKFTHEVVTGYSENIFTENATWNFKIEEDELPDMGGRHPQKCHSYSFSILEDKIY